MSTLTSRLIDSNWAFAQTDGGNSDGTLQIGEWFPVSSFPTTVHVELLKQGKIPDPFKKLHEHDVQWVGEASWDFKAEFSVSDEELKQPCADLVFDGLDTYVKAYLNDKEILSSHNQFLAHRVAVKDTLKPGKNTLLLKFESAFLQGRDLQKEHGKLLLWNGDSSRLHVRKAGYNYGWDWGPVLMTTGPWKPIRIEFYTNGIVEVYPQSDVLESLAVKLSATVETFQQSKGLSASFALSDSEGSVKASSENVTVQSGKAEALFEWEPEKIDLWYPVGYGDQPLYKLEVTLKDEKGAVLDRKSKQISFRRVRVVEEKLADQEGYTFLFEVNNIRIFCGGSNWIPADSFLTNCTEERYRNWLELLVAGNQNMIRVWGGGIYEYDYFYDICDELGILVWQDFMFACGQYPAYDAFLETVEEEATQAVKRLRHHPSLVILAGNNEDYQIAESYNLELDYSDETSDFRKTNFPARYIYERLLPKVVEGHSNIHYHRSSPYSGHGKKSSDRFHGDLHQWNVWHGSQQPWHNWDILSGRFVSEFGMEGYPNLRTVEYWLGDNAEDQRPPQSRFNVNHNKADGFERRLELYLVENFKHAFDLPSYVYYTQIMQAETLAAAYRLWRRNFQGKGREYTAGALVWQLNDCWPTTSWAIVDYFLRPKPAYFTIARELRPYTVGMTRKENTIYKDERTAAHFKIETLFEIWGTNSTLSEKEVTLEVTVFDLHSDWKESFSQEITLAPNSSTEIFKGELPGLPVRTKRSEIPNVIVASARLLDESGRILGRYANWPEPFKYITFPSPEEVGLKIEVEDDGTSVVLSSRKPIKGIVLDVEGLDAQWDDQAIDLVPGDPQTIHAIGLDGRKIQARYLGDGSA